MHRLGRVKCCCFH